MSNLSLPFQIREVTVFPLLPWQRFMLRQTERTLQAVSSRLLGRMMTPFWGCLYVLIIAEADRFSI